MRHLVIRFLGVDEPMPPAARTYRDDIRDADFDEIVRWATKGGPLWGRERKCVAINILRVTAHG